MTNLGDWLHWLVIIGVIAVYVTLVYIAWWALFSDRRNAARLRRCPRCWYDLAYSPGMTCGECGFTATREAQFHSVRRRYRPAIGAIIGCVALAAVINEQFMQNGWAASLPTRALIWLMPLSASPNNAVSREITNRAAMGTLSQRDWIAILDRCAAGDISARPTSAPWRAKYGNFIWQWRQRFASDPALNARLKSIPVWLDVVARESWPAGQDIMVQVDVKDWWQWGMECRVRATTRMTIEPGDGGENAAASEPISRTFIRTGDDRIARRGFPLTFPAMSESTAHVTIDFEISRRPMGASSNSGNASSDEESADSLGGDASERWEVVSTHTVKLKFAIEPAERARLEPLEGDPHADAIIAHVFNAGVVKWPGGTSPVRVRLDQRVTDQPQLNDVAIGLHVDLLCDGELARRLDLWWLGGVSLPDRNYGYEIVHENLSLLQQANGDDGRWSIRITGDEALALRAAGGRKYWKGQLTVPFKVDHLTGQSPPRAWWREE